MRGLRLVCASLSLAVLPALSVETASHGERVYRFGQTPAPVRLLMGDQAVAAAAAVACANCHGTDARGGLEGQAPALDGRALRTARHAVPARSGYTFEDFLRALRDGVDPDGRRLDAAMPRYLLEESDARTLWAFLQTVGESSVGVEDGVIRLWQLIPAEGARREPAWRAARMARGWAERINAGGGIHGRRLRLDVIEVHAGADGNPAVFENLQARPPFAVVLNHARGVDTQLDEALCGWGVPDLFPVAIQDETRPPGCTRPLQPSLAEQGRLLVQRLAARDLPPSGVGIVAADDALSREAAEAALAAARSAGLAAPTDGLLSVREYARAGRADAALIHFGSVADLQLLLALVPAGVEVLATSEQAGDRARYPAGAALQLLDPWEDVERRLQARLQMPDAREIQGFDRLSLYSLVALEAALRDGGRRLTRQAVVRTR